uniref:Retroviral polymerase SH3-like domain-containing protein n=1 Tax=Arundo donax TaxID=35708 RepID=A0A0A9D581_ARUDO
MSFSPVTNQMCLTFELCLILNKKSKSSKFAPKVDKYFLLCYGTNTYTYRVFNKTTGCIEIARDMTFDETNGSQVDSHVLDEEEILSQEILKKANGEIKPKEKQANEENNKEKDQTHSPSKQVKTPKSTKKQDQAQDDQSYAQVNSSDMHDIGEDHQEIQ